MLQSISCRVVIVVANVWDLIRLYDELDRDLRNPFGWEVETEMEMDIFRATPGG